MFFSVKRLFLSLLLGFGMLLFCATYLQLLAVASLTFSGLLSVTFSWFFGAFLWCYVTIFLFEHTRVEKTKNKVNISEVELVQDLLEAIEIDEVLKLLQKVIDHVIPSKKIIALLQTEDGGSYESYALKGDVSFSNAINKNHVIVQYLRQHGEMLSLKRLETEKHKDIINVLNWFGVEAVFPLFVRGSLVGMVCLEPESSQDIYSSKKQETLLYVTGKAAAVIERAKLYEDARTYAEQYKKNADLATNELAYAKKQLHELDKAKSEFVSIASHQLRTPLTALRGYVSMMMEGDFGPVSEKQQPILSILNQSAVRLIKLINSLLDISRIESGTIDLDLEKVDLGTMIEELVTDLLPNAVLKGLTMEFHKPASGEDVTVVADAQRLRQVMLNFIDNAIKYTDVGRIDAYVKREKDKVIFLVQDTGKGISKEDLARLFNKFTRVGGAARYHTEGTGLGLYVAKQIVKEHHGEVLADSLGEGKGSTFSVYLPAAGTPSSLNVGEKATVVIKAGQALQ